MTDYHSRISTYVMHDFAISVSTYHRPFFGGHLELHVEEALAYCACFSFWL